ncbi:MAG: trehalase family glycosidase [Bacteroidales bacterium]|jgi:hypothetical protein
MKKTISVLAILTILMSVQSLGQSSCFPEKQYIPHSLPDYTSYRDSLPSPVFDEKPLWVETYWKAWELAFRNFNEPAPGSGFVSQFADAAFNECIFLWDMSFITMFCNYAHPMVPGISGLNNFYAKQYPDGEFSREIIRKTGVNRWPVSDTGRTLYSEWGWGVPGKKEVTYIGREVPQPNPVMTLDALNHPIAAWAEWESYRMTGDKARLELIWKPLEKYFQSLKKYLTQGNGLYMTDWASMDNSERNPYLVGGGTGIDISAEMVLFANNLADIFGELGNKEKEKIYLKEASELAEKINRLMWDPDRKFYFDLTLRGERAPVKTIAAFWPLLANVASKQQSADLVTHLTNPSEFWRKNLVPTLAADQKEFSSSGDYWCGAVWAPTNTMIIRGLENYGYDSLARVIALNHVTLVADMFRKTGTIWENYAPDSLSCGYISGKRQVMRDFVGWSGIGPILYFMEYAIGIKADGVKKELSWSVNSNQKSGCKRYRFGGIVTSLVAEPVDQHTMKIKVESNGNYTLILKNKVSGEFKIKAGVQEFRVTRVAI